VLNKFGAGGYGGSDNMVTDERELHLHQRLEKLYISTRAGKVSLFIDGDPLITFVFHLNLLLLLKYMFGYAVTKTDFE
jgi:hypothetical protein